VLTFRTRPPQTYLPPTREEMREAANKVELRSFSTDLVADLCNLAAGGAVLPPSAYRQHVRERAEKALPAPDSQGQWEVRSGKKTSRTDNRQEAIDARAEEAMRYHRNVCDFLQTIDLQQFPGSTPLEQAVSMLKLFSKQKGGQGGGEAGEPLPIFSDNDNSEKEAEKLHGIMDDVDSLSKDEQDMLDPKGEAHEVQPEGDGERTGAKPLNKLKIAEDLTEGSDKRVMLEISRTLDQFTSLRLRKQKKEEVDSEGDEVRRRPIRVLSELGRLSPLDLAMRKRSRKLFLYKAVTRQFSVRERITRIEKKQAVFILLDGSGSMKGRKHWKASGVVMNRLKAVLSGDAVVWLSVFDTKLSKVRQAANPAEACELIRDFMSGNFSGGGTDIAASVKAAHVFIEEKMKAGEALYRPEVVVLTDEDTSASGVRAADIPGTRVHGFAMEVENKSLVDFARSTGGVGVDKF